MKTVAINVGITAQNITRFKKCTLLNLNISGINELQSLKQKLLNLKIEELILIFIFCDVNTQSNNTINQ